MTWIFAAAGLGLAGLLLLGFLAFRVLLAARRLGGEVERAGRRLTPAERALNERVRTVRSRKG